jgi:hypothetical protein
MIYTYHVAHSDDALPGVELALHGLSLEEVRREYELADTPFRFFFDRREGVKADFSILPDEGGMDIRLALDGDQAAANDLLAEFLIGWNKMTRGLAVVLVK